MPDNEDMMFDIVGTQLEIGTVVPVLGAGVNMLGRPEKIEQWLHRYLPNGTELARYLAVQNSYPDGDDKDLARVSQFVTAMLGPGSLYKGLHRVFDADYPPTDLHSYLARTARHARRSKNSDGCMLFVTTNYDDGLEQAFHELGEPYDLLTYIAQGEDRGRFRHDRVDRTSTIIAKPNEYKEIDFHERSVIAKIHGAVDRKEGHDSYVITEDHYIEYTSRADPGTLLPVYVVEKLKDSHMLFLGYSLRDWNFRVLLHRVWDEQGALGMMSWAIESDPSVIDKAAWAKRGVTIIEQRLESFLDAMRRRPDPDDDLAA